MIIYPTKKFPKTTTQVFLCLVCVSYRCDEQLSREHLSHIPLLQRNTVYQNYNLCFPQTTQLNTVDQHICDNIRKKYGVFSSSILRRSVFIRVSQSLYQSHFASNHPRTENTVLIVRFSANSLSEIIHYMAAMLYLQDCTTYCICKVFSSTDK